MVRLRRLFELVSLVTLASSVSAQATLTGKVTVAGSPVANARVTLFNTTLATFFEGRTATDGTYRFENLPGGTLRLGVAALRFGYQEIAVNTSSSQVKDFALQPETHQGSWKVIGNTLPEYMDATDIAVLLGDGRVFFCHNTVDPIIFNPANGAKTFPAGFYLPSGCMNGTLGLDGKVFFAGGQEGDEPGDFRKAVRYVRAYDPSKNSWERLQDLLNPTGRWYPGFARLVNGNYLVMGGGTRPDAARTATAEIYNQATRSWAPTGSMLNPSEFTPSALLHTGQVLITWSPPQLYNPATGNWATTGNFNQPNRGWPDHSDHSLIVLADGRALALGIRKGSTNNAFMGEIFNPTSGTWSLTSSPGLLRLQPEVVALPDGRVLVAAGETEQSPAPVATTLGIVKWSDLYDPATNKWRRVADMNQFREYHAVSLLVPDGRVITTGGTRIKFQVGPTSADIEAFSPPYLFRGVRPRITALGSRSYVRGNTLKFTIAPTTRITHVTLMGAETTTHWVNGGIPRRLVLAANQIGSEVTCRLPSTPNLLPLGYYILYAMVDDIPSVGVVIKVSA